MICEAALHPTPGAVSVLFPAPVPVPVLDAADASALAAVPRDMPLAYIGNQCGLVEADDVSQRDQRCDRGDDLGDRGRASGQHAVHQPVRGPGPAGQIGDQLHAPLHRNMLIDQQIHRSDLRFGP